MGAGGLARRKRAERDRAAGEEVTSVGVQSGGRCSHSLPSNDPWEQTAHRLLHSGLLER